jgi:glutamyl-tRNA synthetase
MLYFDDTNPDLEKQEFVDAFHEDLKWLGIKFDGEYYASDHIPLLYGYAERAIGKGKAYVCTCDGERIKRHRFSGTGCEHKSQSAEKNAELWKMVLDGNFESGKAVLRLNSDMKALNTTMRDPTLFRIKHATHYRQGDKYFVWPTYDFCTSIVDSINGVTDVLRDKNYEMRNELYFAVLDALELRKPRITSFSRLTISNNVTSKRNVRALIAEHKIDGWDDPRLVTIRALRRRGITLQAIREFALSSGMGKAESTVPIEALLRINRKMLDPVAKRLFFIENPVELKVSGLSAKESTVSMKLHPTENIGYREYSADGVLCIGSDDANRLNEGDIVRLKDAFNIKIVKTGKAISASYAGQEQAGPSTAKLRWMPKSGMVKCELWDVGELLVGEAFNKDSIKKRQGYAEGHASKLGDNDIVQFESCGLYKLDDRKAMRFLSL